MQLKTTMWDRCRVQHFLHNGRNVRNSSFDIPPKRMSSWKLLESCTRLFRYTRKERPLTASTYNRLWDWSTIGGCSWKRNAPSTEMCHWMVSNEMWQWSSCHWMVSELSKRDHEAVRLHCDTSAELHDTWRRTLSFYNPLYSMHFDETTAQAKKQMDLTLRYWSPTHNEVIVAFYTYILYCVCWSRHSSVKKHQQFHEDNIPVDKLTHLWAMDLMQVRQSWERSSKLSKTSIQNLKDLLILEAVFCISYITVLVKDLKCMAKTSISCAWIFMCDLQVLYCEERGLPATAGQLRGWYRDLPAAHKTSLAKHWPCHSPCAWTLEHNLSVYQGSWEREHRETEEHQLQAGSSTTSHRWTECDKCYVGVSKKHCPRLWRVSNCVADKWSNRTCGIWCNALDPFEVNEKICSGKSTERCTICLMSRYQGSTSWRELVIGDNTRKYLPLLKPDKQKAALLGMLTFWGVAVSHLQAKLPLNNRVLKDLGCLNPLKRERKSTTISIQNLSRKLLRPELDTAAVLDEWKLYQNDGDISDIDTDQRVDHYWNTVFLLTSV